MCNLKKILSTNWVPIVKNNGIHVGLLAPIQSFIVQRSLFFSVIGGITATVHGESLPESHDFWMNVDNVAFKVHDPEPFVTNIVRVTSHLRSLEVCCGVEEFRTLWKSESDAHVDRNLFQEMRHGEVLRPKSCALLVPCHKRRCHDCIKVRRRLSDRKAAADKQLDQTPPAKKGDKYCSSAEKKRRSKRKSARIDSLKRENRRLRMKIAKLLRQQGVSLDPTTSTDLASILESSEEDLDKLTYFQRVLIEQQIKAAKAKRPCGMRWHPAIIRFALAIRAKSGAAYEELSEVLSLPSERTLYDYSHAMSPKGSVPCLSTITFERDDQVVEPTPFPMDDLDRMETERSIVGIA